MGFLEDIFNLKNLGTAVGFAIPGVGPIAGPAIGRAVGSVGDDLISGEDPSFGSMVGAGATGAGMGAAGSALFPGGGGAASTASPVGIMGKGAAVPGAAATAAKGGGFMGGIGKWLSSLSPSEQAMVVSQLLGTGANVYGSMQLGGIYDEQQERRERLAKVLQPYLMESLGRR
jgi:hypothetical protein